MRTIVQTTMSTFNNQFSCFVGLPISTLLLFTYLHLVVTRTSIKKIGTTTTTEEMKFTLASYVSSREHFHSYQGCNVAELKHLSFFTVEATENISIEHKIMANIYSARYYKDTYYRHHRYLQYLLYEIFGKCLRTKDASMKHFFHIGISSAKV